MLSKIINRNTLAAAPEESRVCLAEVLSHVNDLADFYPNFESWVQKKVIPDLSAGDRSILVEYRGGELAGFAIVKDDSFEQKLCCLRVLPKFQNTLLPIRLFERCFEELGTNKPLLSVSEERLPMFSRLFDYFGFVLTYEYQEKYRKNRSEYSFNGYLLLEQQHQLSQKFTNENIQID